MPQGVFESSVNVGGGFLSKDAEGLKKNLCLRILIFLIQLHVKNINCENHCVKNSIFSKVSRIGILINV